MKLHLLAVSAIAALAAALPASRAAAQMGPSMNMAVDKPAMSEEEKEKRAEQEKVYREQMNKLPTQSGTRDPWGKVRGAETPPAAPAATPKAKKSEAAKTQAQTGAK